MRLKELVCIVLSFYFKYAEKEHAGSTKEAISHYYTQLFFPSLTENLNKINIIPQTLAQHKLIDKNE